MLEIFNTNASRMAISSITLSELIYGAEKSPKVDKNLEVVEAFSGYEQFARVSKSAQSGSRKLGAVVR